MKSLTEMIEKLTRQRVAASTRRCVNCQLTHEESAEETEKDNE